MKVKDTISGFILLAEVLANLSGKQNPKLIMMSKINLDRISPVVKRIYEQRDALYTEGYRRFETARNELITKFKKENNLPLEGNDFGDKQFELENLILELSRQEEHRQAVADFYNGMKEFEELLNTEIELELQLLDITWLPKKMNLYIYSILKKIIKGCDDYYSHDLESIDIKKGDIISIVQLVLGEYKNDSSSVPFVRMVFNTSIVRRISTFMDKVKHVVYDFNEIRNKHLRIPEFAKFLDLRNDVMRKDLPMEEKISIINSAYSALSDGTREMIESSDSEINNFSNEVETLELSKIRLDDFDEDIDVSMLTTLFPLIKE